MKIKNRIIALIISLIILPSVSFAKDQVGQYNFGIDAGYAFADIGAPDRAQRIANVTGSTTTYTYDKAAWMLRPFVSYGFTNEVSGELGFFFSNSLNASYRTASGITASESYRVFGFDLAGVYTFPVGIFLKAGLHESQINGDRSISLSNGASASASGYSYGANGLFGVGYEKDGYRVGYTYYNNIGNASGANVGFLYVGAKF
jgi:hypothetical protein